MGKGVKEEKEGDERKGWRVLVLEGLEVTETYILPTLVLVLIGMYIYFATSFYNSSVV